jgi:hypothetical protein
MVDPRQLWLELETALADPRIRELAVGRPHLFASTAVFLSPVEAHRMARVIEAIEAVVALPAYHEAVLARTPAISRYEPGPLGVFLGYDFHLGADGPRLIEINTNAGGPLLNAILARAHRACCPEIEPVVTGTRSQALEDAFLAMFIKEWRLQRGDVAPRRVAIVDDDPASQYLYPEFLLFEQLFRHAGLPVVIADARELVFRDGALRLGDEPIDLVYNRVTDFYFESREHGALRDAYLAGAVVVTPHPRTHALYADKRNLGLLSDAARLRAWGLAEEQIDTLKSGIAETVLVNEADANGLWSARRQLFFKPAAGFGSRAAYRGDKLTRRVWEEILRGDYVAQALIPPAERCVPDGEAPLKFDVRNYVYDGDVQLLAARLYQGQTTNFRTTGGGFAPTFVIPPAVAAVPNPQGCSRE